MIKLKARKGTNNMKKCAFCQYWNGFADVEYDYGNKTFSYEQSITGGCDKKRMKRRANDACPYFSLDARYL